MEIKDFLKPVLIGLTYLVLATSCSSDNHQSKARSFDYHSYRMQEEIIKIRNNRTRFYLKSTAGIKDGTVHTKKLSNGYVFVEGNCPSVKSNSYRRALHQADFNNDGFVSSDEAKKYYRQTIEDQLE